MVRRSADVRKTAGLDWPEPEAAGDSGAGTGAVETLTAASSPRRQNRGCIEDLHSPPAPARDRPSVQPQRRAPVFLLGVRSATARRAGSAAADGAMQKPHQMAEIEFRARGTAAESRGER